MGRRFLSLRTTALLLSLLLFFLLLNVILPQQRVVGEGTMKAITARHGVYAFLFDTLGLAHIPTSPPFLIVLALFHLQLIGVLWTFTAVTFRRVRFQPARWDTWERLPLPEGATKAAIRRLTEEGFRIQPLDHGAHWGVRNRVSPLGFLFFHYSFLIFLAGGLLLHYTRWVGTIHLVRGVSYAFSPETVKAARVPALLPPSGGFSILLDEVQAREERGEPVGLRADLQFTAGPGSAAAEARINHPARFQGFAFLPQATDETLSFKVFDARGFLVDTLAVMTRCRSGTPTAVPLMENCALTVECRGDRRGKIRCGDATNDFPLAEGGRGALGSFEVHFASATPWVSFLVVYERGQGFLIAGFVMAIAGLLFRFLSPRQDVVLAAGALYFKGEYFPAVLRESLEALKEETHDAP